MSSSRSSIGGTHVGCDLVFDVGEPSTVVLSIAPAASAGVLDSEQFNLTCNGDPRDVYPRRIPSAHGASLHGLELPVGRVSVHYQAHLTTGGPADRRCLATRRNC